MPRHLFGDREKRLTFRIILKELENQIDDEKRR
jgi:hypothetical protein